MKKLLGMLIVLCIVTIFGCKSEHVEPVEYIDSDVVVEKTSGDFEATSE